MDDSGQVDGDDSGYAQFAAANASMGVGTPPWHLWGNSQLIEAPVQDSSAAQRTATRGQLIKLSYARPETWHWILAARLESGPNSLGDQTQVEVAFDVFTGIGRSNIVLQPAPGAFQDKAFEQFFFQWGPVSSLFPRNVQIYTTQVLAPNRVYRSDAPFPDQTGNAVAGEQSASVIDHIVAQDLQVAARVIALAPPGAASLGAIVTVEVSAAFAPKTHIRPDWFLRASPDVRFAGGEVKGK